MGVAFHEEEHLNQLVLSALLDDTACPVAFMTAEGGIVRCNAGFAGLLGFSSAAGATGVNLDAVLSGAVAEERVLWLRRTLERDAPIALDGLLCGRLVRTTMRPLEPDSTGRRLVLMTCASPGDRTPAPEGMLVVSAAAQDPGRLAVLTDREREVLGLIGLGLSTAEIAERLSRSAKTIEGHRVSLGAKLGVSNRVQLARIAIQAGLAPLLESEVELKPSPRRVT